MSTVWFLSDLHLKSEQSEAALKFLRLLRSSTEHDVRALVLVGDVFDLWIGSGEAFFRQWPKTVQALKHLVGSGVEVFYFEGNHDVHLSQAFSALGVRVFTEPAVLSTQGYQFWVEHGDQMNPKDYGYVFWRWLLRTTLFVYIVRVMPSRWIVALGEAASRLSRGQHKATPGDHGPKIRSMIRAHTRRLVESHSLPQEVVLAVSGHVHVWDDVRLERPSGDPLRAINLGSWLGGDAAPARSYRGQLPVGPQECLMPSAPQPSVLSFKEGEVRWLDVGEVIAASLKSQRQLE